MSGTLSELQAERQEAGTQLQQTHICSVINGDYACTSAEDDFAAL